MSYKTEFQSNNADLQNILDTINNLPESGNVKSKQIYVTPISNDVSITSSLSGVYRHVTITISNWNLDREFVGIYIMMFASDSNNNNYTFVLTNTDNAYGGFVHSSNGNTCYIISHNVSYTNNGNEFVIYFKIADAIGSIIEINTYYSSDHYIYME